VRESTSAERDFESRRGRNLLGTNHPVPSFSRAYVRALFILRAAMRDDRSGSRISLGFPEPVLDVTLLWWDAAHSLGERRDVVKAVAEVRARRRCWTLLE